MLNFYEKWVRRALDRPWTTVLGFLGCFFACFLLLPFMGISFFPRTDAGQFVINVKAPTGTRIELTNDYIKQVEDIVRNVVPASDLQTVVSNIGVMPDLSSLFTPNSGMHTAFVQVGLKEDHKVSSFVYMDEVRDRIARELPELRTYFQSGGLVDAVLNQGAPAPIDVQVSGMDMRTDNNLAQNLARQFKAIRGVSDVYIPQDMDYPGLEINVNRTRASELRLDPKEVIDNIITSLTSDVMIAPSYWVDPESGNNYFVTVQYPENQVTDLESLKAMPLRASNLKTPTYLNQVADVNQILTPTEVDHYQLERDFDIYVAPAGEDLGKPSTAISKIIANTNLPPNIRDRHARTGRDHEPVLQEFWTGPLSGHPAGVPDPGGAIHIVHRSLPHRACRSDGHYGRDPDPRLDRHHAEHSIAYGNRHAARHGGIEQHPDRGFCQCLAR